MEGGGAAFSVVLNQDEKDNDTKYLLSKISKKTTIALLAKSWESNFTKSSFEYFEYIKSCKPYIYVRNSYCRASDIQTYSTFK